ALVFFSSLVLSWNPSHGICARFSRYVALREITSALYGETLPDAMPAIGPQYLPIKVMADWRCLTMISGLTCAAAKPARLPSVTATAAATRLLFISFLSSCRGMSRIGWEHALPGRYSASAIPQRNLLPRGFRDQ